MKPEFFESPGSRPGLIAFFLIFASGCAFSVPLGQAPRPIPSRLSTQAVRLKVPDVRQEESYLCGLACVEILTQYYHLPLSPEKLNALAATAKAEGGLNGAELKAALEDAGYFVAVFPGSLDHGTTGLYGHLDAGRPVLVMLGARQRHFCVLAGYDPTDGNLDLLDPARGEELLGRTRFTDRWEDANRFCMLALPESLVDPAYSRGKAAGR